MGLHNWIYWIDRALSGDRRPLAALAVWLSLVTLGGAAYFLTR
jgi:hypothetical protein